MNSQDINARNMDATDYQPRRKKYIDSNIQGRLIAGLLLLEVLLFTVAMWFVYQELQMAIDNSLYRVHKPQADSSSILIKALFTTIPWIVAVNVLLIIAIDQLWGKYLAKIIEPLRSIVYRLKSLDLRAHRDVAAEHVVLEHAQDWVHQERERCKAIRQFVQLMPEEITQLNTDERHNTVETLNRIKRHLP